MSFIERKIDVQIALDGDTFDGSNNTVLLQGLRCQATIQSTVGGATPFQSNALLRISGMRGTDMAKLSTLGLVSGIYQKNLIQITAGDDSTGMSLVFSGAIYGGTVDYNAMPEVGVELMASATVAAQMSVVAGSSYKGTLNVASMLQAIASNASPPLAFLNAGANAVLNNHAVGGSTWDQIKDICQAAGISYGIDHSTSPETLVIFPKNGSRDNTVIEVDASSGLVGYPMYSVRGIDIVTEFNPNLAWGRRVKVSSSIPKPGAGAPIRPADNLAPAGANGTFQVIDVVHDLSSQIPGGPWFSRVQLSSVPGLVNTP